MSRKNIFEKIEDNFDTIKEIQKVETLLHHPSSVVIYDVFWGGETKMSIIEYVDSYLFKDWINRGTNLNCSDFKESIGLNGGMNSSDKDYLFDYFEYAANVIKILENGLENDNTCSAKLEAVKHNIRIVLERYGYEVKYFHEQQKALVVQKSAQATAVAEILSTDLAKLVIEYNHYMLKGEIDRKKDILVALGAALEAKRKELNSINKTFADKIFFMLNNLNIRHNNVEKGHKGYNESVAKMKNSTLENWYDELYQMILLAYLLMDNQDRNAKVDELICKIGNKEN